VLGHYKQRFGNCKTVFLLGAVEVSRPSDIAKYVMLEPNGSTQPIFISPQEYYLVSSTQKYLKGKGKVVPVLN
jgi:hypothetical protein